MPGRSTASASTSLDIDSIRRACQSGSATPTEIVEEVHRRIEAHGDPAVWIHRLLLDEVREYAARLERRGIERRPLYGVPFAIKDNIDLEGTPTTAGCPEFTYTPVRSAFVVQRLVDAGAIPIGKTNLDQFATGLVGVRSPYGVPRNPYRGDVIPGGSSSGSAVAVAAGLVSFALGTDTAGSGRIPAGLNNIVGLKPTRGALSTRGVVPACRSLDCVSIFARSCGDALQVARAAAAFDREDPFSRAGRATTTAPAFAGERPRIGVPPASEREFFGDSEAARLFDAAVRRAGSLGADVVEIDWRVFREVAALLYEGPWIAERWAALREFHRDHAGAFLPVTRSIIESGSLPSAADAFDGMHRLESLRRRTEAEWERMDVLLVPTMPRPYTLAEVAADPVAANTRLGTYTNFVNLLDLCAVAIPCGIRSDGIPWGVTLVAPAWEELGLLDLGARLRDSVEGRREASERPAEAPSAEPGFQPRVRDKGATRIAVVGAHLSGLPLNRELTDRGATLAWTGETAPAYRLYALPNTTPQKPGLLRTAQGGSRVEIEVWELPSAQFGNFVAGVPSPLCIGSIELSDGTTVKGFLCEPAALEGARDITAYGGWRAFLAGRDGATRP